MERYNNPQYPTKEAIVGYVNICCVKKQDFGYKKMNNLSNIMTFFDESKVE
jgi:hypothetical protein